MDGWQPRMDALTPPADAPSPQDRTALRNALGRFATGVCVVTCAGETGPVGMTINSFASLSLDPPLIMWSPAKSSNRAKAFRAAPRFAIHVLKAEQRPIADAFVKEADAFGETLWRAAADGLPLIDRCLARFVCDVVAEHDAGDHVIAVGRVTQMSAGEGAPLLFNRGRYATLS
ncbi:MAG: flavin reductase family protein [Pseudomonadota bacterium]